MVEGEEMIHTIYGRIDNFEGYLVSIDGEVVSQRTTGGELNELKWVALKHNNDNRGYRRVTLSINNMQKKISVHRLVMLTFKPLFKDTMVNHKDDNGLNNSIENLEWSTATHNERHSWKTLGKEHKPADNMRRSSTLRRPRNLGIVRLQLSKTLVLEAIDLEGKIAGHRIASRLGISRGSVSKIMAANEIHILAPNSKEVTDVVIP